TYNDRSPWNLARQFKDEEILTLSTKFAKLRHSLIPYISAEAEYCVSSGRPLMAQLCVDFPDDEDAWNAWDEYMFGRSLLVAPVYTEGAKGRKVYLPEGAWEDIFTKQVYEGEAEYFIECPLDRIPVFVKKA
ncbi:MAG: glycoside hydrolase, partial [Clostridia bacterium]|nr:glycoside hydrolase [Clostridia bacterium]